MAFKHAYVLTGGIACGKSTVSSLLKANGFRIIDADKIAKEQLELHSKDVVNLFSEHICDDGVINRKKLANIIFNSKEAREKLNNLLHPLIREAIRQHSDELDEEGLPYIIDIPLFFESSGYDCKMSVVVYTPKSEQLCRLIKRDGLSEEEAMKRIDSQMDIEKKRELADWVIDNSSDLKHLQVQTRQFIDFIRSNYANSKI